LQETNSGEEGQRKSSRTE